MTLVVPCTCLDNIFMVLLISALATIGATKPIFLDSGSPREGGGVCACVGMVCYHWIVHILNSSKNPVFFVFITLGWDWRKTTCSLENGVN